MTDPLTDQFAKNMQVFTRRVVEAQRQGVCIICEQPPTFYSEAGRREYRISGTCEPCFDRMFEDTEDTTAPHAGESPLLEDVDPPEPHNDPNWMNP